MARDIKSRVAGLKRELKREITTLERELAEKKSILAALAKMAGRAPAARRKRGRPKRAVAKAPAKRKIRKARRAAPARRKSKNRDAILAAARTFKGRFRLNELTDRILKKNPRFGGKHPAGAILAVLKNTPEIKKVKRGLYRYKS